MKLADSHTHILDERLSSRADDIVTGLVSHGLEFIVEIGADVAETFAAFDFAQKHEKVYCTAGVHPHYACMYNEHPEFEIWVRANAKNPKLVAIGECGLDYHYMNSSRESQIECFIAQIKLAHNVGLPLVVHSRDAFADTYGILKSHHEYLTNGVLIHCYSYGVEEVEKFNELGCYFAFGGAITYKKACVDALRAVPSDRLVLETDCPYLAPCPLRGTTNEPKNVHIIAEFVARELGKDVKTLATETFENTKRFYNIA